MADKKVKIINPNKFMVGLKLMDGVREVVVHPKSFIMLDENEVYFINNMSRIFRDKHLLIDDEQINQDLGYTQKTVVNLSDDEIKELLKGSHQKMKKELEGITEKHVKDRVIDIAKGMDDLTKGKITFLQEWSGYDFDQIVETNNE
jgi:hypothetical protein